MTLGSGEIYEITSDGAVARCVVINRDDVTPEVGARCAAEMDRILRDDVLSSRAGLAGLIFDVRRGPAVFGPRTRENLERLFGEAERARKRLAVRVGDAAIQKLQFTALCRECAPSYARVAESDADEAWVRGS